MSEGLRPPSSMDNATEWANTNEAWRAATLQQYGLEDAANTPACVHAAHDAFDQYNERAR